jgi:hypothetical protein
MAKAITKKKAAKKRADNYEKPLAVTANFAQVFQVVKKNKEQKASKG